MRQIKDDQSLGHFGMSHSKLPSDHASAAGGTRTRVSFPFEDEYEYRFTEYEYEYESSNKYVPFSFSRYVDKKTRNHQGIVGSYCRLPTRPIVT
jgi:hypothetical protein